VDPRRRRRCGALGGGGRPGHGAGGGRGRSRGGHGERHGVGRGRRTRTLPGTGAERIRLAATCCSRYAQHLFGAYGAIAAADVDLVVHLGDYIYEDTKGRTRPTEPDHTCVSLDDYRTRYSLHRRDPHLQALHAAHPVVAVWDDHDLADNAWRDGAKAHDPGQHGPWAERKAAALQAHNEFLPKRLADPADPTAAWRRLDAGDLVSLVLTETRAHRDEPVGAADDDADVDDPHRTILGPEQRAWLLDQAADTTPAWLVLASGTVVSELEFRAPDRLDRAMPEKYAVKDGLARNSDQWDGYPAERAALTGALARRDGPTLVLSGDLHSAWAVEGLRDEEGRATVVELVTPPAATTPVGRLLPPGLGPALGAWLTWEIDGTRWVDLEHFGFVVVDIGRSAATATWFWVDPKDPASAAPARTWRVEGGPRPRLVEVPPAQPRRRRWPAVAVAAVAAALVTVVLRRVATPG
jgi:alkaline phosphatase D